MTTQQTILIEENSNAISELGVNLIYGKNILTRILKEWHELTGKYLTIQELSDFFEQGRSKFLVPKYTYIETLLMQTLVTDKKKLIDGSGLQISSQKLMDLVDLPDLTALNEIMGKLIYIPDVANRETIYWNAYTTKGLEIVIIESVHEQLKNHYRAYAETEKQKAKLLQVQKLCKHLNAIYKEFPEDFDSPTQLEIDKIVKFSPVKEELVPSATFVVFGVTKTQYFEKRIN